MREGERKRERERERERETETDRQTDRQTERDRQTDRDKRFESGIYKISLNIMLSQVGMLFFSFFNFGVGVREVAQIISLICLQNIYEERIE